MSDISIIIMQNAVMYTYNIYRRVYSPKFTQFLRWLMDLMNFVDLD